MEKRHVEGSKGVDWGGQGSQGVKGGIQGVPWGHWVCLMSLLMILLMMPVISDPYCSCG